MHQSISSKKPVHMSVCAYAYVHVYVCGYMCMPVPHSQTGDRPFVFIRGGRKGLVTLSTTGFCAVESTSFWLHQLVMKIQYLIRK